MKRKKNKENIIPLNSELDIIRYINEHKEWWKIGLLQNFIDRISILVSKQELRLFFSMEVAKIRKELQNKRYQEDVKTAGMMRRKQALSEQKRELGDIYGDPQFYQFGENGNNRKKHKATKFLKEDC